MDGDIMVSIVDVSDIVGKTMLSFCGLSTDTKPIEKFNAEIIRNGSTYFEMDTGNAYMYDEENKVWHSM